MSPPTPAPPSQGIPPLATTAWPCVKQGLMPPQPPKLLKPRVIKQGLKTKMPQSVMGLRIVVPVVLGLLVVMMTMPAVMVQDI